MKYTLERDRRTKGVLVPLMLCCALFRVAASYPFPAEDIRYLGEYTRPGAHQFSSWYASKLGPKELIIPVDVPIIPYRLPVQGKRNSEVTNAIIGSEETQKMYRDGRK